MPPAPPPPPILAAIAPRPCGMPSPSLSLSLSPCLFAYALAYSQFYTPRRPTRPPTRPLPPHARAACSYIHGAPWVRCPIGASNPMLVSAARPTAAESSAGAESSPFLSLLARLGCNGRVFSSAGTLVRVLYDRRQHANTASAKLVYPGCAKPRLSSAFFIRAGTPNGTPKVCDSAKLVDLHFSQSLVCGVTSTFDRYSGRGLRFLSDVNKML